MFGPNPLSIKIKMLDAVPEKMAETLEGICPLVPNVFQPGDLITQVVTSVDPNDGEPVTAYMFPLPGQPAKVAYIIPNTAYSTNDSGPAGPQDTVIIAMDTQGVPRYYTVCSSYFTYWRKGDTVAPNVREYLEKMKAKRKSSQEDGE